ncbi:MAG: class I SAM-dependent methyltransferase [Bacteroidetes bacterium]|nr:class I SAM-dependent methyltransferase [Bacteroidota bacterium]
MHNTFIATTFDWDHRTPVRWQRLANKVLRKLKIPMMLTPPQPYLTSVEVRMNLFHLLDQTIAFGIPGDVVELGCNEGDSTIVMRMMLDEMAPEKELHAYDSFEGLPEISGDDQQDGVYAKGNMAVPPDLLTAKFKKLGLKLPVIHKGWFEDTVPKQLPGKISFALIDGDLYSSTMAVLPHVYERLSPGGIGMIAVYVDDEVFPRPGLQGYYKSPGVKRAVDEFFADKPEKVNLLYSCENSNAYFRKL